MNLLILIVDIVLCIDSILFGSFILTLVPLDKIYSNNIEIPDIVVAILTLTLKIAHTPIST